MWYGARIEAHIGQTRYADKFEAVDIREVAQIKAQGGSINRTATKYLVKMAKKNEKEHGGMDKSMMWHLPKHCTNACH